MDGGFKYSYLNCRKIQHLEMLVTGAGKTELRDTAIKGNNFKKID